MIAAVAPLGLAAPPGRRGFRLAGAAALMVGALGLGAAIGIIMEVPAPPERVAAPVGAAGGPQRPRVLSPATLAQTAAEPVKPAIATPAGVPPMSAARTDRTAPLVHPVRLAAVGREQLASPAPALDTAVPPQPATAGAATAAADPPVEPTEPAAAQDSVATGEALAGALADPAVEEPPAAERPARGPFAVQAGAFRAAENADALVRALATRGVKAYAIKSEDGKGRTWHLVRVGRFDSAAEASRAAAQVSRAAAIPAAVVTGR